MWIRNLIFLAIFIVLIVISLLLHKIYSEFCDYFSIIGSIASVFGIIYTLYEIFNLKSTAEAINVAIENNTDSLSQYTTFKDINVLSTIIDEIEVYAREKKIEPTLIKLKYLKDEIAILKEFLEKSDPNLQPIKISSTQFSKLNMFITQLSGILNPTEVNWSELIEILEKIKDQLNKAVGAMKKV